MSSNASDNMSKKSQTKKRMLGKQIKRARRMPLLVSMRTHRRISSNRFQRNWRSGKLKKRVNFDAE